MKKIELDQAPGIVAMMVALAAVAVTSALTPPPATAQSRITESPCPDNTPTVLHECALEAAKAFDPPRTPDGQPDMGGIWRLPGSAFEDLEEHRGCTTTPMLKISNWGHQDRDFTMMPWSNTMTTLVSY